MNISSTKKRAILITALCSFVYFTSYFARKDFAAVMAGMLEADVIDKTVGGFISMALFICYGIGQLISGYLADKFKPQLIISAGLLTTCLCNLALPFAYSGYIMIPIWALNGLAQAMMWPPIIRILSSTLPHESFVKANLYVTAAAHVATILLYLFVPICLTFADWKAVFFTASALSGTVLFLFALLMWKILTENDIPFIKKDNANINGGFFQIMRAQE